MDWNDIKRLFHLVDELTVSIEDSDDEEIKALSDEANVLYNKIDELYVREMKSQKMEPLR